MADYFRPENEEVPETPVEEDLSVEIKEQLVERLEQEILGALDVNFLFNKGEQLRFGLID